MRIRRAVLSVYDKEGLIDLARGLVKHGVEILSSGGTATCLRENGIPVRSIVEHTGMPEILDGRVKTLHPRIAGGILARDLPQHDAQLIEHGIAPIDLVVVNLYPFARTLSRDGASAEEIIEMIDIGGPTLIRAAAKNHERVSVLVEPRDYPMFLQEMDQGEGGVSEVSRLRLAGKAFAHTAAYDAQIARYFSREETFPEQQVLCLRKDQELRYGENPHQRAALYRAEGDDSQPSLAACEQLQGKELSYNNLLDADAALGLVLDLPDTAVVVIKHSNPCGAASTSSDPAEAFRRARATDPVSAFGGIVACNCQVDPPLAGELKELFLEAVIAPGYAEEALRLLSRKKNLRVLRYASAERRRGILIRSIAGGLLLQDPDLSLEDLAQVRVVSARAPSTDELLALDFAWRVCKHVKSNAIVFARSGQLVGVGAGQMSRVDSVRLAVTKAQLPLAGSVLASDAFFPFRDGIDEAAAAGATAVVQPGGSIRDEEVIAAANEHNMAMILTGIRHFRH